MSSVGLALKTQTRLAASPHMQHAVHLLQLSAVDFTQELQQALSTNPFLEEADELDESTDTVLEADQSDAALSDIDDDFDGAEPIPAPLAEDIISDGLDQFSEREEQRDPFDGYDGSEARSSSSATASGVGTDPFEWVREHASLREHLLEQVCGWGVTQRLQMAATVVIDSLDDDGYLRGDIFEASEAARIQPALSAGEIEEALRFVQGCDPAGVGARDLSECLALQLAALDDEPCAPLATRIVREQLDALSSRRYAALRQALSCDDEALNRACALIRRLDPRPGLRYTRERPQYVVPDVIVREQGGDLVALVNPAARPGARLNQCYVQWFRAARHQDHPALSQQLQEARWLMHGVEQRFSTIQRVAEVIVRRQRGFFAGGEIAMKPLVLREVADELGIHESTVSRATNNKYMETTRGLFEFRHFFSRKLATETGGSCSAASVRALMKEMIANEQAPKSDVALAKLLTQNGVQISRRTVTKYRNLMKVAPVELRRRA